MFHTRRMTSTAMTTPLTTGGTSGPRRFVSTISFHVKKGEIRTAAPTIMNPRESGSFGALAPVRFWQSRHRPGPQLGASFTHQSQMNVPQRTHGVSAGRLGCCVQVALDAIAVIVRG